MEEKTEGATTPPPFPQDGVSSPSNDKCTEGVYKLFDSPSVKTLF